MPLGRKGTRQAVAAYFGSGSVAGLNTVYTGEPRVVPEKGYLVGTSAGTKSGAQGWPWIEAQRDKRIAFTGGPSPSGLQAKLVLYEVSFSIRFWSLQAKGETALDDHDAILDAFVTRLRADRTLGGTMWQAGEGDTNEAEDIHVVSGYPKERKATGPIVIWSMIRFLPIEAI